MKEVLLNYEYRCLELAREFTNKYFTPTTEIDYVANDPTGVACIGEYFFSVCDMYELMKNHYSKKRVFEWYDYSLDAYEKEEVRVNIKNYKKLNEKK